MDKLALKHGARGTEKGRRARTSYGEDAAHVLVAIRGVEPLKRLLVPLDLVVGLELGRHLDVDHRRRALRNLADRIVAEWRQRPHQCHATSE